MNYAERIERLRSAMQNQGVEGVFLPLDAHLEYFTGLGRVERFVTKHRQNSEEYGSLLVTAKEVVYCNSRLLTLGFMPEMNSYPEISQLVIFPDADLTGETFVAACTKLGLKGKKLAYLQDISSTLVLRLQNELAVSWVNFDAVVQAMRAVKDPEEQQLMRKAARIADRIYSSIFPQLLPGTGIVEITQEIERLAKVFGAEAMSFTTSVKNVGPLPGAGRKGFYPVLQVGYVVAFDYGVVYKGYCSDFGRTVFIGQPPPELVRVHELIMKAQKTAIAAMKGGQVTGEELNRTARGVINDGGYDKEFEHRLGHGIGKDVHERPFLAESETRVIEPGMLFTVEPSIVLPGKAIIRVEDVVLATPTGGENLNTTTWDVVVVD